MAASMIGGQTVCTQCGCRFCVTFWMSFDHVPHVGYDHCRDLESKSLATREDLHIILDVDPGVDDASAIVLALGLEANIEAITCVNGNTNVEKACDNVRRVLKFLNKTSTPVYEGCDEPLTGRYVDTGNYFGEDGLGNVASKYELPHRNHEKTSMNRHAALRMLEMAKAKRNLYTLVLLGPLTNAAVALKIDQHFTSYLKDMFILGGNYRAVGNVLPGAEFNFWVDPEAADVVLAKAQCPVTIVPWESSLESLLPWELYNALANICATKAQFYKDITAMQATKPCRRAEGAEFTDSSLAVLAAPPITIVPDSQKVLPQIMICQTLRCQTSVTMEVTLAQGDKVAHKQNWMKSYTQGLALQEVKV
ncbi:nucleoside hydrolase-like [Ornithodoros turicata]|uniref:nucleoside hydrolase-like n=1 Tax=Ornithodoros turicata TaxID=34597 RepID=UPI003138C393